MATDDPELDRADTTVPLPAGYPEPCAAAHTASDVVDTDVDLAADTRLLYELGTMRHVQRTWRQFGGVPYANVAEHSFRVAWIAWIIARHEHADAGRAVLLALIHDSPETRTGDVNYLSRMYTERNEGLAIADQFHGSVLAGDARSLWAEYEARVSLEARIVKDADTIDCDLELNESQATGCSLLDALRGTRESAYQKLNTATAKRLYHQLYGSDPHAWHTAGRNRHTEGDWKA